MKIITLLIFLIMSSWAFSDEGQDHLMLSTSSGKAPLKVKLIGPDRLMSLGKGTYQKWTGCEYQVEWGDGPNSYSKGGPMGSSCSLGFEHTYQSSGIFIIKAQTYHPNPDDSQTIDWAQEIKVTVQ